VIDKNKFKVRDGEGMINIRHPNHIVSLGSFWISDSTEQGDGKQLKEKELADSLLYQHQIVCAYVPDEHIVSE
jgi:hypothetical protein